MNNEATPWTPTDCSHSIEGPRMHGGRIVAWRRRCKRKATKGEWYCWQHLPLHRRMAPIQVRSSHEGG